MKFAAFLAVLIGLYAGCVWLAIGVARDLGFTF